MVILRHVSSNFVIFDRPVIATLGIQNQHQNLLRLVFLIYRPYSGGETGRENSIKTSFYFS
jgi:hypothetical protein